MFAHKQRRARLLSAFLSLVLSVAIADSASAQGLRDSSSLKLVPADAAFYSASFRLRQQFDAFVGSNAFAAIKEIPVVQMGMGLAMAQLSDPNNQQVTMMKAMLDQPENKQLVSMLTDAVSHEIFMYGDEGFVELLAVFNELGRVNNRVQFDPGGADQGAIAAAALDVLAKYVETSQLPDSVLGFKLTDAQAAQDQLQRLEFLAGAMLGQQPALQNRFSRKDIGGASYLTLDLDGSLVPWEAMPLDQLDPEGQEKAEKIIAGVKQWTLNISIGVKDDYLILAFGDTNEHLSALGQAPVLQDREEMQPLWKYENKPIVGVNYVSESFQQAAYAMNTQLDDMAQMAEQVLPMTELSEELQREIVNDTKKLAADLKAFSVAPGAAMGFSFITENGYEGFTHSWAENDLLDASKPLSILNNVGGDPIFFLAMRGKQRPEAYDLCAEWCERGLYYADKIAEQELAEDEREFYKRMRAEFTPLVDRLDRITRALIPVFDDGQAAIVLDAKATSKQWHESLPPSDKDMPMLELGIVYRISDADTLKKTAAEYFAIGQEVLDKLHAADPTEIPEVKLPAPSQREFDSGEIFYYRLPKNLGLDKNIAPSAGVTEQTLAFSLIPKHTLRLITPTTLQTSGILAQDRPVASAVHLDFAGLIEAIAPWVEFGVQMATGGDPNAAAGIQGQVDTGLEVLKCFRGVSGITYRQDGMWVSHYESRFEDLE